MMQYIMTPHLCILVLTRKKWKGNLSIIGLGQTPDHLRFHIYEDTQRRRLAPFTQITFWFPTKIKTTHA